MILIGVGDCPIDLLVQVEDSFIECYLPGHRGGDLYCTKEMLDEILTRIESAPKKIPGGSAANTVRALSFLGQPCAFLGAVGPDEWGEEFRNNFQRLGIESRLKEAFFTPRVLCLISPDGQRTFLVESPPALNSVLSKEDLKDANWIHLEARSLASDQGSVEKILRLAKENGIRVSMDLSSFEIVEQFKDCLLKLIPQYLEIVFCNEDEIEALTGLSPERGCFELQRMCPVGVVTLGEKGCLTGSQGIVSAISSLPVKAIDTTGAGDYFAAGFLFGYLRNRSLEECGLIGNRLGSAIVQVIGTELDRENWDILRSEVEDKEGENKIGHGRAHGHEKPKVSQ